MHDLVEKLLEVSGRRIGLSSPLAHPSYVPAVPRLLNNTAEYTVGTAPAGG
ncbi:MAG: hypothetical protein ACR2K2_03110 [Mycobacteriales bacterium]